MRHLPYAPILCMWLSKCQASSVTELTNYTKLSKKTSTEQTI
jgi:hypothetical protein